MSATCSIPMQGCCRTLRPWWMWRTSTLLSFLWTAGLEPADWVDGEPLRRGRCWFGRSSYEPLVLRQLLGPAPNRWGAIPCWILCSSSWQRG